jgi:hypothetical protein
MSHCIQLLSMVSFFWPSSMLMCTATVHSFSLLYSYYVSNWFTKWYYQLKTFLPTVYGSLLTHLIFKPSEIRVFIVNMASVK